MLFGTKDDAENFDIILKGFSEDDEAMEELRAAVKQYPCLSDAMIAIENHEFQYSSLEGPCSDELIDACERMAAGYDGLPDDDCYSEPIMYLLEKLY